MSWVSVRKIDGEERMQISFKFAAEEETENAQHTPNGRLFNMDRLQSEELEKAFARIQVNVSKFLAKKNKKKKKCHSVDGATAEDETSETINIKLTDSTGNDIDVSSLNEDAWKEGSTLVIAERSFSVRVNPPNVKCITLPKCIMSGYPVHLSVDAEFVDLSQCRFTWYREVKSEMECKAEPSERIRKKKCTAAEEPGEWTEIFRGQHYMPENNDIGSRLKVSCLPSDGSRDGEVQEVISKTEVTAGPGYCPFMKRHELTKQPTPEGQFRMVTYNILADLYADSDYSRENLYPYCPPYALEMDYRKQLLLKEITGYNSDIICLQEVDRKVFMNDLLPVLEQLGFDGFLMVKLGQVPEGTATFYRKSKFRLLGQHDIGMLKALQTEAMNSDLWEKICTNDLVKEKMIQRTSVFQVTALESIEDPTKILLVGTAHLYFHPRAPHIRILQTAIYVRHLEALVELYTKGGVRPSVVYSGDFNSYTEGGVHHFLNKKHIGPNHADWFAGGKTEFVEDMELFHNLNLTSACGYPRYTNFVTGFSGCLDYIYVDKDQMKTVNVVPMPTHEEVTQYTALPNAVFPSDHIALVCDLTWT